MANDRLYVPYQMYHRIVLNTFRFIAQVIAAQVERDRLVVGSQRDHLVAPRVPEIRETVDHDDQWS